MKYPEPGNAYISGSDVVNVISELENEQSTLKYNITELEETLNDIASGEAKLVELKENLDLARRELMEWNIENGAKLTALRELRSEIDESVQLVHDSVIDEYVLESVRDEIKNSIPNYVAIDWSATADNLKSDYTVVEFGGETYYYI